MKNLVPTQRVVPDFSPVPRKCRRYDGWTAERQRAFLEALADLGSVKAAAARVNMAQEGAYALRRHPDGASFRAAWDATLAHGVQRLADIAIDRAIEGVPVPVFHKGEQVGEKRSYNDRLLMFLLKHHLPGKYGTAPLHPGTRHPDTVAREAAENCPVCRQRAEEEAAEPGKEEERWLTDLLTRYEKMIFLERRHRLTGRVVAADFTLRQLTHLELILDCGGKGMELIDRWTKEPSQWGGGLRQINASPISKLLDDIRRDVWAEAGEPEGPALNLDRYPVQDCLWGGPTHAERDKARRAAEARIAAAQAEWEAAAQEETWKAWKAGRGRLSEDQEADKSRCGGTIEPTPLPSGAPQ